MLKKMLIGRAFSNEKGRIKLFGKMDWMLYPARAMAYTIHSIGERLGDDYVFALGYMAGYDAGKEITAATGIKLRGGWTSQKVVVSLLDFIGFGTVDIIKGKIIDSNGNHDIVLHVKDNPEIEHGIKLFGKKEHICTFFRGVYSAHLDLEMGTKKCKLKEVKCMRDGHPHCEWASKSVD